MLGRVKGKPSGSTRRLLRRVGQGLLAGAASALVVLLLRGTGPLETAERKSYDARARWAADPAAADSDIVIVAIDDNSLEYYRDELGRWPWPRDVQANLVRFLHAGGARLAVFDILFNEPNLADPEGDAHFADWIERSGIVVLPLTFSPGDSAVADSLLRVLGREATQRMLARSAVGSADGAPDEIRFEFAEPPYPAFGSGARALGAIVWNPDPDGVSRRERLVYAYRGRLYPSLPLAAARVLEPQRFGGTPEIDDDALRLSGETLPLEDGEFLIRWHGAYRTAGQETYRVVSAATILKSYEQILRGQEPELDPEAFRDKVVFIALTGIGLFEARANPIRPHDPGVFLHATVLDNLLNGDAVRRAPALANVGMVLATALAGGVLVATTGSALVSGIATLLVLLLALGAGVLAYHQGVWLDLAAPILAGALSFAATMSLNYMTEGRERRRVRDLFSRYVSPEYVKQLADDPKALRLGGERVPLTLLFSDIRGFTSMSEKLPPETVVAMLNEYLEKMAEVVFRHGGTLDKFIGDAVMAFWGAPIAVEDHARRAAEAALDMLEELDRLNERWQARGAPARVDIGIGINTGEAVVGNIGSLSHKLDYTAIGDTVNLASRLEGLNKQYGTHAIVSEMTRDALGDDYEFREIDEVRVKGKEQPVRIYELRGRKRGAGRRARAAALPLVAMLLLGGATALSAQEPAKARWTDWVYRPGAWQAGRFVDHTTTNATTDSLAVVGLVEGYARPPRWRAEVRRLEKGAALGAPVVLVGESSTVWVRTRLGVTPLEEHAAAEDPLVQAVVRRFAADGPDAPTAPTRLTDRGAGGTVRWIFFRQPRARTDFPDHLLEVAEHKVVGRNVLRMSVNALGGARDEEVVASAGARGVAKVQTVDGEIEVMPDTAAIRGMELTGIGLLELDRFLREAGLGVYQAKGEPKEEEKP